ncbi:MAG: hypothetical protein EHM56_13475 [Chloroflexi bacterium]|nr:MAG: hypothetical protein EHM56_13475 [Chloroflexota bacterium]
MLIEIKPERARKENRTDLILLALFIAIILLTFCVLSVILLSPQKEPRPTPKQAIPVILVPTASLPTAMPANYFSVRLPIILSESVSSIEQIWKVTKIKTLGYELDGLHYDAAIFTRVDSHDTVKAYCMNRGWDTPDIGTEYLLNAGGIFVPLHEPDAHPIQRFLRVNNK